MPYVTIVGAPYQGVQVARKREMSLGLLVFGGLLIHLTLALSSVPRQ